MGAITAINTLRINSRGVNVFPLTVISRLRLPFHSLLSVAATTLDVSIESGRHINRNSNSILTYFRRNTIGNRLQQNSQAILIARQTLHYLIPSCPPQSSPTSHPPAAQSPKYPRTVPGRSPSHFPDSMSCACGAHSRPPMHIEHTQRPLGVIVHTCFRPTNFLVHN